MYNAHPRSARISAGKNVRVIHNQIGNRGINIRDGLKPVLFGTKYVLIFLPINFFGAGGFGQGRAGMRI